MDLSEGDGPVVPPRRLLRAEAVLARRTSRLLLVLETLQDANNYAALLRTADSFGIQHVWVVIESSNKMKNEDRARAEHDEENGGAEDDDDDVDADVQAAQEASAGQFGSSTTAPSKPHAMPKKMEASERRRLDTTGTITMGAGRWLSLRYFTSTCDCIDALRADGRDIWVSTLRNDAQVFDRHFPASAIPDKVALVVGREIDGVSPEFCEAASRAIFLPMIGFSESFNVSVAGALLCQRMMDLLPNDARFGLCEGEKNELRKRWYTNLGKSAWSRKDEYLNYWLPRAKEVEAAMIEAIQREGEAAVLRPVEALRAPLISKKMRKRIEASGKRPINTGTVANQQNAFF